VDRLGDGLAALGLGTAGARRERLDAYIDLIRLWNPRNRLVADAETLVERHILDSLAGLALLRERRPRRIADIGSGAGLPGIPLAIWMDRVHFALVERSGKRAGFLRNAVVTLGLSNVEVIQASVERLKVDEPFDLVTFRAWSAVDGALLDAVEPLLASGGVVAAYKGRREVLEAELRSVADRIGEPEIRRLEVPGLDDERHLVVFGIPGAPS